MKQNLLLVVVMGAGCIGSIGDGQPGISPADDPPAIPGGPPKPGTPSACTPGARPSAAARVVRLTERQYANTIRDLTGAQASGVDNPFAGNFTSTGQIVSFSPVAAAAAGMPEAVTERAFAAADQAAALWAAGLKKSHACLAGPDSACWTTVFSSAGARALRRPMAADETKRYVDLVSGMQAGIGADQALVKGLTALLASPHFLFRTELGDGKRDTSGRTRLTPWEVASALSYTLIERLPDSPLQIAAAQGNLVTVEQVRTQIDRLLGTGAVTTEAAAHFLYEWLPYDRALGVSKSPTLYPHYLAPALVEETNLLARYVLGLGDRLLPNLFTTTKSFVRKTTAPAYGVTNITATAAQMIDLPPRERSGIITQPSFLAAFSDDKDNEPIKRGRYITESLLCGHVPDLPIANFPPEPDLGPNPTLRQKLDGHRNLGAGCPGCHTLMDGIGLGLEGYDHTGRVRTKDVDGKPVNTTGVLVGAGPQDGPFDGALQLGRKLVDSPVTTQCFVRQSFRYWLARPETERDDCTLVAALSEFEKGRGNLRPLLVALLGSDSFLYRN